MPIYRGDKKIVKIYRGDKEIKSVYRGDRQVFSSGKQRVLLFKRGIANVYKAIYVSNKQSSNIPLNFMATPNFDQFSRKYEITYENISATVFYRQKITTTYIGKATMRLGGTKNSISNHNVGKHKITIDKTKLYLDDAFVQDLTIGDTLDATQEQIILLNNNSFYEMKIYDNDVLVYHFVPAYFISSNGIEHYGIANLVNQAVAFNDDLTGEPEYE